MKTAESALSFELLKGKQGQNRRGGQINGEMDNRRNYRSAQRWGSQASQSLATQVGNLDYKFHSKA